MGVLVAESVENQNQTGVVVDKKKNRRSRRSKQNSPPTGMFLVSDCIGICRFRRWKLNVICKKC